MPEVVERVGFVVEADESTFKEPKAAAQFCDC
jgi:hypothetical protein